MASFNSLSFDHCFKLDGMASGEKITCGWYSENEINFAIGTNFGAVFLGSLHIHGRNRVECSLCRINNICKQNTFQNKQESQASFNAKNKDLPSDNEEIDNLHQDSQSELNQFIGVTNIHFPSIDPIGTMLVSFDDGTIKLW
jgi:hypothetical protein